MSKSKKNPQVKLGELDGRRQPSVKDPHSNYGVSKYSFADFTNTKPLTVSMGLKIDWLAFTIEPKNDKFIDGNSEILNHLGYLASDFEITGGKNFFNTGRSLSGYVQVYYNSPDLEPIKGTSNLHQYIFSGVGCTDLSEKIQGKWIELFQWLKDKGARFRRIDIALDDMNPKPKVTFSMIENKLKAGEYKSSKRHYNIMQDINTRGEKIGETVYIGQRKSGTAGHSILRAYDKFLQMIGKNQESQIPIQALKSKSWIRWEIEVTKEKAVSLVDLILEKQSISEVYHAVLRDIIDFKVPTKTKTGKIQKNKSRWKTCKWWLAFLHQAESAKLQDPAKTFDLATALSWVRFSVVPTLQMIDQIYENHLSIDFYKELESLPPAGFSKKQKRVIRESSIMSDDVLESYLNQFRLGTGEDHRH